MRASEINRKTSETEISLKLNLDGKGISRIDTGMGFLDHMLTLFSRHGGFDLDIQCDGDLTVDGHHSTEDIGICLGRAFSGNHGWDPAVCPHPSPYGRGADPLCLRYFREGVSGL